MNNKWPKTWISTTNHINIYVAEVLLLLKGGDLYFFYVIQNNYIISLSLYDLNGKKKE